MSDVLDAPVLGFRRWQVNSRGQLEGYGVPVAWTPGIQTAECRGQQSYAVAEYCDPPKPKRYDAGGWTGVHDESLLGWSDKPLRLPDGRWVKRVTKKSCQDPSLLPIEHPVPSLHSRCGIWAHKQPIPDCTCAEPGHPRHGAVGVVRMTGRGVEHTDGWRAEHAEVVALVDHSRRLSPVYDVPRYASTAAMYAEWAPDHDGWAARHDACWCDHGRTVIHFGTQGYTVLTPAQMQQLAGRMQGIGSSVTPAIAGIQGFSSAWLAGFDDVPEDEDLDPKAKALRDKQTRNANHPGQDRPEKSRRKRKGWRP